jgi:hypothetical protein
LRTQRDTRIGQARGTIESNTMRPSPPALLILLATTSLRAETLPTFHPASCSRKATHIVVVKTHDGGEGKFSVGRKRKGTAAIFRQGNQKPAIHHIPFALAI